MRLLALLEVERREPLAGRAYATIHRLPELVEVPVAGRHVELGRFHLSVRREQVVDLLGRPVTARLGCP